MLTVYDTTDYPGLVQQVLTGTVIAASPTAQTFTLPAQGAYLATIDTWTFNPFCRASVVGVFKWFSYNSTNNFLATWSALGAVDLSAGQAHLTAMTVSNPTTAGVVTITSTSPDANPQTNYRVTLRQLTTAAEMTAV